MNLDDVQANFEDGEKVNMDSLFEKGIATSFYTGGFKLLSNGELTKKVQIEANFISKAAQDKLDANKIKYEILN